jgi:DNA-binding beta-propeller fold protein YncE
MEHYQLVPPWSLTDGIGTGATLYPDGLARGKELDILYFADYLGHAIRSFNTTSHAVLTLASDGSGNSGYAKGAGNVALFDSPRGLVYVNVLDSLLIADSQNNAIRRFDLGSGQVTTLVGSETGLSGSNNVVGFAARFSNPQGIAFYRGSTDVFVTDTGNNQIRRVSLLDLSVTLFAGNSDGFPGVVQGPLLTSEFPRLAG